MPRIVLTSHLKAVADCECFVVTGDTVRSALEALFALHPLLRNYLLDDRGALRHHVAAFVNGVVVTDKELLGTAVPPDGEIFLAQALSGG